MPQSVAQLCQDRGLTIEQLASQANLEPTRALAILEDRWTPSPEERAFVAAHSAWVSTRSPGATRPPCSTSGDTGRRE